jgi:hypothetical protein
MVVEAIGYFMAVLLTESLTIRRALYWLEAQKSSSIMRRAMEEDIYAKDMDVEEEEKSVLENKNKEDYALCIDRLVKIYPPSLLGKGALFTRTIHACLQIYKDTSLYICIIYS